MEVLPITNTISQWPGNGPETKFAIGNIGTGNICTMATLTGHRQPDGSLSGIGSIGGLLAVAKSDCPATNSPTLNSQTHQLFFTTYDANGDITMRTHRCTLVFIGIALCLAGCTLGPDSIVMEGGRLYPTRPTFAVVSSSQEINCASEIDFDSLYSYCRIWRYEGITNTNYYNVRFWPTGECSAIGTLHQISSNEFCDSFKSDCNWSVGFYKVEGESIVFEVYAGGAYVRYFGTVDRNGIHVTRVDVKYQNANFTYSNEEDMYYYRHHIGKMSGQPDWSPTGVLVRVQEK